MLWQPQTKITAGREELPTRPQLFCSVTIGPSHIQTEMFIRLRSTPEVSQQIWGEAAASGHFLGRCGLRHKKLPVCQQRQQVTQLMIFQKHQNCLWVSAKGIPVLCNVDATQTPCTTGTWLQAALSACCRSAFTKGLLKKKHKCK